VLVGEPPRLDRTYAFAGAVFVAAGRGERWSWWPFHPGASTAPSSPRVCHDVQLRPVARRRTHDAHAT
jgi:hypothetical protein